MAAQPTITSRNEALRYSGRAMGFIEDLLQVLIEPDERALRGIGNMLRISQSMALAWIDHDGGRHVHGLHGMPEFLSLRRRAFDVVLADPRKGRRFRVMHV